MTEKTEKEDPIEPAKTLEDYIAEAAAERVIARHAIAIPAEHADYVGPVTLVPRPDGLYNVVPLS